MHGDRATKLQRTLLDLGLPLSLLSQPLHPPLRVPAVVVGVGCRADVLIRAEVGGWRGTHVLGIGGVLGVRGSGEGRQGGGGDGTARGKWAERGGVGWRRWGGQVGWVQPWRRGGWRRLWAAGVQGGKELCEAQLQVLKAGVTLGQSCPGPAGILQRWVGFWAVLIVVAHRRAGRGVGGGVRGQVEAQAPIINHGVVSHVETPVHSGLAPNRTHGAPIQRESRGSRQQRILLFEHNCETETVQSFSLYILTETWESEVSQVNVDSLGRYLKQWVLLLFLFPLET